MTFSSLRTHFVVVDTVDVFNLIMAERADHEKKLLTQSHLKRVLSEVLGGVVNISPLKIEKRLSFQG